MHRRNQAPNLIDADTILRDITTDDLRNQAEINLSRGAFIGHIFYPKSFDWNVCGRARVVYAPRWPL